MIDKKVCYPVLCNNDPPIVDRKSFRKWSMKNHPDKVSPEKKQEATTNFQNVSQCVDDYLKETTDHFQCGVPKEEKPRKNKKKSSCVRKIENWTNIKRYHRFDKASFEPELLLDDIVFMSPKLTTMLDKIKELDTKDMNKEGKLYKHFIFSDVKEGGYGSKIIASALSAHGYHNCFSPTKNGYNIQIPEVHPNKNTYGLLSSTSIYDKPTNLKTAKNIVTLYNKRPDNVYGENMRFIILDSGFKEGIDLFDVKYVHIFETPKNSADLTQAVGRATRSCGQKGLQFKKNKGWELFVFMYASTYGESNHLLFDKYLKYEGVELGKRLFRENLEKLAIKTAVDSSLNHHINKYKNDVKKAEKRVMGLKGSVQKLSLKGGAKRQAKTPPCYKYEGNHILYKRKGKQFCRKSRKSKKFLPLQVVKTNQQLSLLQNKMTSEEKETFNNYMEFMNVKNNKENMDDISFEDYQKYINQIYGKYKYDPIIIENLCETKGDFNRIVEFSKSQDFVSHFLTPQSKHKGLLVWHSVGTGKTCTAVATKSLLFEKQDYTILWVTRTTLKEDIWKNMFVWVCDHHIRERLQNGENIPENPSARKKYIQRKFLEPVSYRQFSNAMMGKGKLYEKLVELNGKQDILKKTFVIIDEAHKLYSNDLVGMEKPDTNAIERRVFNSYQKSKQDSCKLMMMTATPIADDPMEFFKLTNLIIENKAKRFSTEYDDLVKDYVQSDLSFTQQGKNMFQDTLKGLISYLNRSYDPRQFTQPTFQKVNVPLSNFDVNSITLEDCNQVAQSTYEEFLEDNNIAGIDLKEQLEECLDNIEPVTAENLSHLSKKEIKGLQKEYKNMEKICHKQYKTGVKLEKLALKEKNKSLKKCNSKNKKTLKQMRDRAIKTYQLNALEKCGVDLS